MRCADARSSVDGPVVTRPFAVLLGLAQVGVLGDALLSVPAGHPRAESSATRVRLTDGETGREILSCVLAPGDRAVLTWRNSLFDLAVTEVFVARREGLELTSVTFADRSGREPPLLRPQDLEDVYHTGGPFRVEGLSRPIHRVVFRVGEIGDPTLRMGGRAVRFLEAVGFGGAIVLTSAPWSSGSAGKEEPCLP